MCSTIPAPESYDAAKGLLDLLGATPKDARDLPERLNAYGADRAAKTLGVGVPTLRDIAKELSKPRRDPRDELPAPVLRTDALSISELQASLEKVLEKDRHDISVLIRTASSGSFSESVACEPYVVTTDGPDGPGLIAAMARVFARHNINIDNIKAVLGHGGEDHALFVLEVQVPLSVDIGRLRRELHSVGKELGLNTSVQHRDIFEAMHRISDF